MHWRLKQQRYALVGEICPHCTYRIFPPRDICPDLRRRRPRYLQISGRGEVYSPHDRLPGPCWSFRKRPLPGGDYPAWKRGPLVTAQLTDLGEEPVEIGTPVEMVTRKPGSRR